MRVRGRGRQQAGGIAAAGCGGATCDPGAAAHGQQVKACPRHGPRTQVGTNRAAYGASRIHTGSQALLDLSWSSWRSAVLHIAGRRGLYEYEKDRKHVV
ncbi:hypothetical protein CHLRE_12g486207v5 [Chlamydomonas reinhardtii]|uniref:Uncharacterized protein n=1 Tax=Chlamydomonas reinhardtii TaxID=3055 RepID=A0A2K3D2G0_CHLRE|nr:uncharacterized protein CHLRE_12g486207v5 [Chlamydomonas reinhardtii]PNW74709.1 hypothetical protein CHLRE_12g486207v5 [Chlamydomonas reinhardtii]